MRDYDGHRANGYSSIRFYVRGCFSAGLVPFLKQKFGMPLVQATIPHQAKDAFSIFCSLL